MIRLLVLSLRQRWKTRVLSVLTLLGIALGVAAVVSVQLLNASAVAAFRGSVDAVRGGADLGVVGTAATFDEAVLVDVLATPGVSAAWPVVVLQAALARAEGPRFLELRGLDVLPLARLPFAEPLELGAALGRRGWVALTAGAAELLDLEPGDSLEVSCGTRVATLRFEAVVKLEELGPAASPLRGVLDLAMLQDLLGEPGRLHRVEVSVAEGSAPGAVAQRLRERLGPAFQVLTPAEEVEQAEDLLAAFRMNLTALSAVSLFVGFFLVYTATQASLVRRRREFGVLRALGATRGQLLALVAADVAFLGVLGTALGVALGWFAARLSLDAVSATLTNLYLREEVRALVFSGWIVPVAVATGLAGALAGALWPSLDTVRQAPHDLLATFPVQERVHRGAPASLGLGVLLPAAAFLWVRAGGDAWRPAGFVLGLAVLAGLPLVTPFLLERALRRVPVQGFGVAYGLRSLSARLHGSAFSTAALAVSVSILLGLTVMVSSFRRTVESWVEAVLPADVYVTSAAYARAGSDATLDPALVEAIAALPGVRQVDRLRRGETRLGDRPVRLVGVRMDLPGGERRFSLLTGSPGDLTPLLSPGNRVIASEPLARRLGLAVGDRLELPTEADAVEVEIAGIYRDYGTEFGALAMDLGLLERLHGPGHFSSVSLYLEPGIGAAEMVEELRARWPEAPLVIRSNARLREEVLEIFDQTFLVTRMLEAVTLLVAALGVATSLFILAEEQRGEIALARALGARRGQVFTTFLGRGAGIGALGVLLGAAGGAALAWILVKILNPAYFGWTLPVHWPALLAGRELATIAAAVVLASLAPSLKASRVPARELARVDS